jgi:hypothetical protein
MARDVGARSARTTSIDDEIRSLPSDLTAAERRALIAVLPELIEPADVAFRMGANIAALDPETALVHLTVARRAIELAIARAVRRLKRH